MTALAKLMAICASLGVPFRFRGLDPQDKREAWKVAKELGAERSKELAEQKRARRAAKRLGR